MKICMLTHDYPPLSGGMAAHVYELSKALVAQGHQVWVVTQRTRADQPNRERQEGIELIRLAEPAIPKLRVPLYALRAARLVRRLIVQQGIEVVHNHNETFESLATRLIGPEVAVVFTAHSSSFLEMVEQGRHRLLRFLLARPNLLLAPSQELLEAARPFGSFPRGSLFISNAVDADRFNPQVSGAALRERLGIPATSSVVLCPRRLVAKNGVEYLARAMRAVVDRCPDVRLLIAGDGPERSKIEGILRADGVLERAIIEGNVPNQQMPEVYAACDVAVLPSLKEATSIAGLEAMATGRPLVGSNVGGIPQIVAHGESGLLVDPADPAALASAIGSLLEDPETRRVMGAKSRELVERYFAWPAIAQEVVNAYERARA